MTGVATLVAMPSGIRVDILNPKANSILLEDILECLKRIKRFSGTSDISVSAHSAFVRHILARMCMVNNSDISVTSTSDRIMHTDKHLHCNGRENIQTLLWYGLLHDAHEAYVGDIIGPTISGSDIIIQRLLPAWAKLCVGPSARLFHEALKVITNGLDAAIYKRVHLEPLPPEGAAIIRIADNIACSMELAHTEGSTYIHPSVNLYGLWDLLQDIPTLEDEFEACMQELFGGVDMRFPLKYNPAEGGMSDYV